MPTVKVSLQDAIGATTSTDSQKMRTPAEVDSIMQQVQAANTTMTPDQQDQMRSDLASGADVNLPGLVDNPAPAHAVKRVSLADAIGARPDQTDSSDSTFSKIWEGVKRPIQDVYAAATAPNTPVELAPAPTAAEADAAKALGFSMGPDRAAMGLMPVPGLAPWANPNESARVVAKQLPADYGQPTKEEIAQQNSNGFLDSLQNPVENILHNSILSNAIQSISRSPLQEKYKMEQVKTFLQNKHILDSPDQFPADQVSAAKDYFQQLHDKQSETTKDKLKNIISSIKTDPGKFVANLANGLIADPELLVLPAASAVRGGASGAEAVGAAARAGRVVARAAARVGVPATEAAALNTAIDAVAQSKGPTGGIDPSELKVAAIQGAALGGTLGAILHNGAKAKIEDTARATPDKLEQILKDRAAYDDLTEAVVKNDPTVPSDAKARIEQALGITSKTDREAFLKKRREDVKAAFRNDGEYADYLQYKAEEAATRHEIYTKEQEALAQRKSAEAAKQNDIEQAYATTAEERKAQYQKEFEAAQAAREQADLTDAHTQAIAEDQMRTAQNKIDAEDALLAAYSDDLPAVKQAMAKIKRRNPTWKQRGSVDPEMLARFGLVGAGAGIGAYGAGPDHRMAGGLAGAIAGLLLPAGGDINSAGRRFGGAERGVIGGRKATTADVGKLSDAEQMEAMGRDSVVEPAKMKKDIYNQTGWYRGNDGAWKFEISDSDAKLRPEVIKKVREGGLTQVKNILDHPKLWEAYPQVGNIEVRFEDLPKNNGGHFDPNHREIVLNKNPEYYAKKETVGGLKGVLLHEIQHVIQTSEGFARGGSSAEFLNKIPEYKYLKQKLAEASQDKVSNSEYAQLVDKLNKIKMAAFESYRRLAGEVESRNIQRRVTMTDRAKEIAAPFETEDTPAHQQMVKFGTNRNLAQHMEDAGLLSPDGKMEGVTLKEDRLPNEADVIARAKQGDQRAFAALYKQYAPRLERSVRSFMKSARNKTNIDAQDIAQEAFIKAFKNIDSFQGNSQFYTWLHRIAQNEGLMALRAGDSRIKTTSMFNDVGDQGPGSARAGHIVEGDSPLIKSSVEAASASLDTPENMARAAEVQHQLEYAFSKLNDKQRAIVKGVDLEGKTLQEVSSELGIDYFTAGKYLQRGREAITNSLEKGYGAQRQTTFKGQRGSIDPDLLKKLAIGGAGAATGAYLQKDHKLWGAALGAGAFLLAGAGGKSLWRDVDTAIGAMSTRIKNKSEAIHFRAKEYYRVRNTVTHDLINAGHPFLAKVNKMDPAVSSILERSILTGDRKVTDRILDAVDDRELTGSWNLIKTVIDGLGDQLHSAGMIKKKVQDYFPRIVKDKEGLFTAIGKEQGDAIKQLLDQANREQLRKSGNPLSQAEESEVINKALASFMYSKAPDSVRAGYTHARRFQEIPEELQKYYANLAESFHSYVRTAVKNIEMAKFFGKDLVNVEEGGIVYPDIDKSIGKYVEHELRSGKISTDDVAEVSSMLRSAFVGFERGGNKTIQAAKNITMAGYLGNPLSAVVQITTPVVTTYLQGIKPTLQAVAQKLTGKSVVTAKDFGLADHMSEEFVGTTRSAKFLRGALKWGGFKFSDLYDKDIKLNAAVIKARDLARSDKGVKKLDAKYGQAFGDRFPTLVKELKSGTVGPDTKALAYMELSRSDPIDPLEFSQFYADNPNGRNLLALKSYMLKQVDLIRRDAYNEIKSGNKAVGIRNLAALSLVLGLSGMAGQDLQDVMLGRKIKFRLSDIPMNMLKTFGWSEYQSRQAMGSTQPTKKNPTGSSKAKQKLFQTVGETLAPPVPWQAMDDLWNRDPHAVYMIPVVGRFLAEYYKNKYKTKAQKTREKNQL